MSNRWQLQHAKAHFSEVVDLAIRKGPQVVTRRGKDAVVVVAAEKFQQARQETVPLGDFLFSSPLRGAELDLRRAKDKPRPTPNFE
jgi:prevent-host-death family protein